MIYLITYKLARKNIFYYFDLFLWRLEFSYYQPNVTSSCSLYPLISTNPAFSLCMWIELMIKHVLNMIEISTWMNVFEHDHTFHHGFPRRSCFLDFCHFKIDEFLTTNEPRLDTVYDVDNRAHIHGTALTTVLLKFNVSLYGMICQMNIIVQIVKIEILAFSQFLLWNGQTENGQTECGRYPIFEVIDLIQKYHTIYHILNMAHMIWAHTVWAILYARQLVDTWKWNKSV